MPYFQNGVDSPKWTRSHLAKLLRHRFYIGNIVWRGEVYPGKHEPLVDRRTWQRAQDALDGRNRARHHRRRRFTYGHGLIRCAHCGHRVTGELHKGRYRYYRCAQVQNLEHPVRPAWVPESVIESQIVTMLDKGFLRGQVRDWTMDYLRRVEKADSVEHRRELPSLQRSVSRARADMDALLLKAAQAERSLAEEFMRLARQKQQELTLLRDRLEQVRAEADQDEIRKSMILKLAEDLLEKFPTLQPAQKRQIVDSVLVNVRLDRTVLAADYTLPFSILAESGGRCGGLRAHQQST